MKASGRPENRLTHRDKIIHQTENMARREAIKQSGSCAVMSSPRSKPDCGVGGSDDRCMNYDSYWSEYHSYWSEYHSYWSEYHSYWSYSG